ncbi:MAG: Aldolase [Candidatus Roizmanbacteria bacterium GW2011_GWA2_35_19]|uniref:Aldolase n=2 Tax=Candidatus Roizmaniibacteriota TaxID=1752723 RepID=A0A0G0E8Q1_9BACT|nr:MAG: Aldolase [Candidatus Roizmanbacteria bacterium GW2011_GWC2_35_12]KKP71705.1 MAG: Aldolase [Candidatus Roizmanbacteria bacterium GW2011_GWA2_35_19]
MQTVNNVEELIYSAVISPDDEVKKTSRISIRNIAKEKGIRLASIQDLYMAFGQGKVNGFTVPAINVRTLTYDLARQIFQLIKEKNIGPVIFEIARSEIKYTSQDPDEYTVSILAAAIAEDYVGPVFVQGDHYQFSAKNFAANREDEINKIKELIKKSVEAGFYNIDIDASTLVDLTKKDLNEQQKNNYEMTALLTEYIRTIQPKEVTISIGGEIGHIGGINSSVADFEAFMDNYLKLIESKGIIGISKVSVQTGTSHGGIPMKDGRIAKVSLDFSVLKSISESARTKYKIGGSVQHGASTLPNDLFHNFPSNNTLEIHLATGFQNIVYDNMPQELKLEIYKWLDINCKDERKPDQTDDQFYYKTRKKALGPFKKQIWEMEKNAKTTTLSALKKQFEFLFAQLNLLNTSKWIKT